MENEFILAAAGIQPPAITEMQSWQSPHPDLLFHTSGWDAPAFNPMVSSPAGSKPPYVSNDSVLIRELIGNMGGFGGNPTEIVGSSCYSTPLSSPLKLEDSVVAGVNPNFAEFAADPGFVERAARFSCFGSRSFNGRTGPYIGGGVEFHQGYFPAATAAREVKLGRVSSSPSLNGLGSRPRIEEIGVPLGSLDRINSMESPEAASSVIEPVPSGESVPRGSGEMNPRKRKGVADRGKTKEPANVSKAIQGAVNSSENLSAKRYKSNEGDEQNKKEGDREGEAESKQNKIEANPEEPKQNKIEANTAEPPKDYIHVRARRGQATDSHSLAERVRREKISERMKLLQDLVPSCNKVTGKALMLDEIINYVQSLQRQVEFLSMKLASVNTILDVNSDSLLSKDHHKSNNTLPHHMFPGDSPFTAATTDLHGHHHHHHRPLDSHFTPPSNPQYQGFSSGGDDLHTIVQMGLGGQSSHQDTTTSLQPQRFHY